jgi:hypothetical protein
VIDRQTARLVLPPSPQIANLFALISYMQLCINALAMVGLIYLLLEKYADTDPVAL